MRPDSKSVNVRSAVSKRNSKRRLYNRITDRTSKQEFVASLISDMIPKLTEAGLVSRVNPHQWLGTKVLLSYFCVYANEQWDVYLRTMKETMITWKPFEEWFRQKTLSSTRKDWMTEHPHRTEFLPMNYQIIQKLFE